MNNSDLKILVDKYLNGTATPQEQTRLFEYYEHMQTNRQWDEELMGDETGVQQRIYNRIQQQIEETESRRVRFRVWKLVASVALIIGVGIWGLRFLGNNPFTGGALNYETVTATKNIIKIRLEDGTQIWLNNGSRLRFPEKFGKNVREVTLEGEAYFDVVHKDVPFIIHSGKITTQVLGTSFNIRAFATDNVSKVSVISGKVGVKLPGKDQKRVVFLERNQQASYNKNSYAVNKETLADASTAISWIDHKIKFRNTPLPDAMAELERIYDIHISYQTGLKLCPVFADFSRTDDAAKILHMLARSLGGKLTQKDTKTFYLSGLPCR